MRSCTVKDELDWEEEARVERLDWLKRHRVLKQIAQEQSRNISAFRAQKSRKAAFISEAASRHDGNSWRDALWEDATGHCMHPPSSSNLSAWEQHENRWRALKCEAGELSADDISWPPYQDEILHATARLILECDQPRAPEMHENSHQDTCTSEDVDVAYKAAFRRLSLRWHPDKFQSKCGSQIPREQQAALVERVSVIFQCVSTQWQQHVRDGHGYMLYSLQQLQSLDFVGNLTCGKYAPEGLTNSNSPRLQLSILSSSW